VDRNGDVKYFGKAKFDSDVDIHSGRTAVEAIEETVIVVAWVDSVLFSFNILRFDFSTMTIDFVYSL
jgi:hypothetical protein